VPTAEPKKDKDAPPTADTALEVEGMASQADADKIEAAIKAIEGIISVSVDLVKKQVRGYIYIYIQYICIYIYKYINKCISLSLSIHI